MITVAKRHILPVFICLILFAAFVFQQGCSSTGHFITNRKYRKQVKVDYEARRLLAHHRDNALFGIFDQDLILKEKEALQFLFAYMPLADLAEYDGKFFLDNVRHSLKVQDSMPWGRAIPEDIFRHYVLPVRVNNENLDSARWVFYPELKPRVKGLTLEQAALEVNRWCHEKVTYKATDDRTSSPLNTVKNAFGRCGEESVLTVAALRSVGIPARQVYVPRWAHSDDNHAWVEVWVDGKWHYMGACEPEPVLNRGWFTGPAKRAMLVHTRVFGRYQGDEEVVTRERDYAVINSTAIYAEDTKPLVTVIDEKGRPVTGAKVEFGLYNYAEFYPIATLTTDKRGECYITTGKGDILLHATDGNRCTWSKHNLRTDTLITLIIHKCDSTDKTDSWYFDVPDEVDAGLDQPPEEIMAGHKILLAREDSIRNAYVKTFPGKDEMIDFAREIGAPADRVVKYLSISQGNHREITRFLRNTSIFMHLQFLTEKDIRDTKYEVLYEVAAESPPVITEYVLKDSNNTTVIHTDYDISGYTAYTKSLQTLGHDPYLQYIWNPKIDLEMLKPYRNLLNTHFAAIFGEEATPQMLFNWIRDSIKVDTTPYYSRILITPSGVHNLRVADPYSRNLYFVATCRSMGIPARLEPATKVPQALIDSKWVEFNFDKDEVRNDETSGSLKINKPESEYNPGYYIGFTIARLEKGVFKTLEFPWEQALSELLYPMELKTGYYAITSGIRNSTGDIDIARHYFTIKSGRTTTINFPIPKPEIKVYGCWPGLIIDGMENGFILLVLEATGEPSRHLLQEVQNTLASDPAGMLPVFIMWNEFDQKKTDELIHRYKLEKRVRVTETDQKIIQSLFTMMPESATKLPLAAGINSDNEIVFLTGGYQINSISRIRELVLK